MERLNRRDIRETTQRLVDSLDQQKLDNIAREMERESLVETYIDGIRMLDKHALCQGKVKLECDKSQEVVKHVETQVVEKKEEVHGEGCHCEKCCPHPNPTWLQKNKNAILLSILWFSMLVLAIGWSPSGKTFDAIQTSYVELIVNFFKMAILGAAGVCTFKLMKVKK